MGVLRTIVAAVLLLPLFFASRALAAPDAQVDASTKHLDLAPYLDVRVPAEEVVRRGAARR